MTQAEHHVTEDDRRFFDDIPAYNHGELSESEREWMDEYIARFPQARIQLEFERDLARGFKASIEAIPKEQGWEQLLSRVNEYEAQKARKPSIEESASIVDKLKAWFNTGSGFAVAMSIVALQFAVILFMAGTPSFDDAYVQHRGMSQQAAPQASAKINLSPEASLGDVLALLRTQSATIVAGPGATGELWIALPEGDSQSLEALRASPLVEAITVLTNLPK